MSGIPARASSQGDPCPSWCVADHSQEHWQSHVGRPYTARRAWACAVRDSGGDHVSVCGSGDGRSAAVELSTGDAQSMAAVAAAAGAGELAAAIRQAVAQITGAGH